MTFAAAVLNIRQEADGVSAFARKSGKIHRNQPVSGSVAPIFSGKRSILRIAGLGGDLQLGEEPEAGANLIRAVKMVPLTALREYGFSERFCELAIEGFPESGTYKGSVSNIGL